jgi:hypothetical protein
VRIVGLVGHGSRRQEEEDGGHQHAHRCSPVFCILARCGNHDKQSGKLANHDYFD